MKRNRLYVAIGMVTVSLFTMSLLVSAQPQGENAGRPQMGQQQAPGEMGRQGMQPGMNRGDRGPQGKQPGSERGQQGMWMNWQELGLSEEQQAQLQQIQRDYQVNTATLRTELRYAQQDLRTQMQQDAVDQANIDSLLNTVASLKQRLSEAETQRFLAVKAILTPEQVEKLAVQRQPVPPQLRGVELTDAQRTQIGSLMEASREKTQALREELRELRDEHRDLLFASGETDAAKLQQIQSSITAKEVELEKERVNEFLQIKALLTPEQLEQTKQARSVGKGGKGGKGQQKPGKRK